MNKVQFQFHGVVLLYGYLQRLFVYGNIKGMLDTKPEAAEWDELPQHLDHVSAIFQNFDRKAGLNIDQIKQAFTAYRTVEAMTPQTFPDKEKAPLSERLAVTGAALYAEEYINTGLIHLGMNFDPKVEKRYRQQAEHYKKVVKIMTMLVEKTAEKKTLSKAEADQLQKWYQTTMESADTVKKDIRRIRYFLNGTTP
ncbi:hypothetical protein [Planococcus salinus]|uniref:Uncharacterized protein n=1 Tax=Planococcus salinus TaxID=1848460 RepID=A0A3M8P4T2_9BACL|nr:hypothetical protein [Planococcus salinus]RNF38673.1 hypothetical protein EEX84_12595 [Planococcus salinus]